MPLNPLCSSEWGDWTCFPVRRLRKKELASVASHRRPKQTNQAYATVLTATAATAVALSTQSASADPLPDPGKKGVQAQVDRLYEEATQATEKYNGAEETSERLQKEVASLQEAAARKQGELNDLRNTLGSLAASQYRGGGLDPSVQLLLSADPDAYLEQSTRLGRVSDRQGRHAATIPVAAKVFGPAAQRGRRKAQGP